MQQDIELSDYTTIQVHGGLQGTEATNRNPKQSERRLLRIGILTLAVLCILQATLNISLHLAFSSKEDIDRFPFNSSVIADFCQTEQSQQTQVCSYCNNLLQRLLREYRALETERDRLQDKVRQLRRDTLDDDYQDSGSGSAEELFNSERNV